MAPCHPLQLRELEWSRQGGSRALGQSQSTVSPDPADVLVWEGSGEECSFVMGLDREVKLEGSHVVLRACMTCVSLSQAGFYYCQAASSHHPMAQYRYARYLLQHGPGSCWDRHHKAVALLEQAAGAGITEVGVHRAEERASTEP